jgi:type IV secretion system protein VirD4
MLGQFTERATSRGRSRSLSQHVHTSVSRTESEQRRALLLPQEFKELGPERLVVIFENCKPILGEKIRYHRDKAFTDRLLPPPAVPMMNMDLHIAKAQQRCRYLPDVIGDGEEIDLDRLAYDVDSLPELGDAWRGPKVDAFVDAFCALTLQRGQDSAGGAIEPVAVAAKTTADPEIAVDAA